MRVIIGIFLSLILTSTSITNNLYAEGGNQVWLTKTKRGIDISCPYGYQYKDETVQSCTKVNEATFNAVLSYNDLYIEEEFFDEKEIMKQAILAVKLLPDVEIIEKKTSSWFGKITADIKYEKDNLKGLQRMMVFNDGTMIVMQYLSKYNDYDIADKTLSSSIKLLEPNQVAEIEREQKEYAIKAQEIASKKASEDLKKKLEQEQKAKEVKKKAAEKKKAEEAKIKANDNKLKTKSRENIKLWREKAQQLDYRFAALGGTTSEHSTINYDGLYNGLLQSIKKYESAINNLKNTSQDKIDKVMKENEKMINQRYDVVNSFLQKIEDSAMVKEKAPTYKNQYDQAYGNKTFKTKELNVEFQCSKKTFSGAVKDQNGSPIVNASVILMYDLRSVSATTRTDVDGKWEIDVSGITFHNVKISAGKFTDKVFEREFKFDKNFQLIPDSCKFNPIN